MGAGAGGLATAAILAGRGYHVDVFEKNHFMGGRCGRLDMQGHRFDTGATFLMMPGIYEQVYRLFGREFYRELDLNRVDPCYRLKYGSGKMIDFTPDRDLLRQQMESIEPGSYDQFLRLLPEGEGAYRQSVRYVLDRNFTSLLDPKLIRLLYILIRYRALTNHYHYICRIFRSDELRILFTFQNLYLGQDPMHSSGIYFFLPFMDLADGVLYPAGGMNRIITNIAGIAEDHGAKIHLDAPVSEILVDGKRITGIKLGDGTVENADAVVANADLPYVYNSLLPPDRKARRLGKKKYTCSALVFHWGMDVAYPGLLQHNVYVPQGHRAGFDAIFSGKSMQEDPTVYLHSPVRSDPSAAPPGQDSLSAIVHVGHLDDRVEQDWNAMMDRARQAVIERLEAGGLKNFRNHIKFEVCHTPRTFHDSLNLTRGAVFGSLAHNIMQMGYFRPGNRHKKYRNLYFTGGSTQPGSGMPLALLSAKLVTERMKLEN